MLLPCLAAAIVTLLPSPEVDAPPLREWYGDCRHVPTMLSTDYDFANQGFAEVALDGDIAAVAWTSFGAEAAMTVHRRLANGTWTTEATFSVQALGGGLPRAVAVGDGRIAVKHSLGITFFEQEGAAWSPVQTIAGSFFNGCGNSLAMHGSIAVVGDPHDGTFGVKAGLVRVYVRGKRDWSLSATIAPPVPGVGQGFGTAVALDGSHLAVGEPGQFVAAGFGGKIWSFVLSESGWVVESGADRPDGTSSVGFGYAVALHADELFVGAPFVGPVANSGKVYQFTLVNGAWQYQQSISETSPVAGQQFGADVAVSGDWLAVGRPKSISSNDGRVRTFHRENGSWVDQSTAFPYASSNLLGSSVAMDDDELLAGAIGGFPLHSRSTAQTAMRRAPPTGARRLEASTLRDRRSPRSRRTRRRRSSSAACQPRLMMCCSNLKARSRSPDLPRST